jgi:hypothetical protein
MRGRSRTKEEKHELFQALEYYLSMGFSLKKACNLADVPYSTVRDMLSIYEPLRAYTTSLQNQVNVKARANIIATIEKGDIQNSKWWLEHCDQLEAQVSPQLGGEHEMIYNLAEMKQDIKKGVDAEYIEELRSLLKG